MKLSRWPSAKFFFFMKKFGYECSYILMEYSHSLNQIRLDTTVTVLLQQKILQIIQYFNVTVGCIC